jgi:hypothetical protein
MNYQTGFRPLAGKTDGFQRQVPLWKLWKLPQELSGFMQLDRTYRLYVGMYNTIVSREFDTLQTLTVEFPADRLK